MGLARSDRIEPTGFTWDLNSNTDVRKDIQMARKKANIDDFLNGRARRIAVLLGAGVERYLPMLPQIIGWK
jgi:hypothetical protein